MSDIASVQMSDLDTILSSVDNADWFKPTRDNMQASGLPIVWDGETPATVQVDAKRRWHLRAKRALDVCLAGAALFALAPLMLVIAAIIKLTSEGPVFFRQKREGLSGSDFVVFKFRSFANDACDASGVAQTTANDGRVTPVGRFIRKTSIDELPQLINVLKGDMSLVGPRPHVAGMLAGGTQYRDLVPYYDRRLDVLPGLTGWAQCNGLRGPTDNTAVAVGRIDHDIAYVQNLSIWLDIKIILVTLRNELLGGSGS